MRVRDWIKEPISSLLDVGCNDGAWLADCARWSASARLAGVDINSTAVNQARKRVPNAEIHNAGAERLPFHDASFQYVTCMEVLEHLPAALRAEAFREIHRVLRPGGRLVLTVPHAGWFTWLDCNNLRYRFPCFYNRLIHKGLRDSCYESIGREVEWHHHFNLTEIMNLAGEGWTLVAVSYGGLFVFPLMDLMSWPFYRLGKTDHLLRRLFERIAAWDYRISFGPASYGVLVVLEHLDNQKHKEI
jgi:SAM-dependent methyltransferase